MARMDHARSPKNRRVLLAARKARGICANYACYLYATTAQTTTFALVEIFYIIICDALANIFIYKFDDYLSRYLFCLPEL